jgi:hypothetical protein
MRAMRACVRACKAYNADRSHTQYTTQIDHYDNLGHLFDTMRRINVILIDLSR